MTPSISCTEILNADFKVIPVQPCLVVMVSYEGSLHSVLVHGKLLGKAIGLSLEKFLALFMETPVDVPAISPKVISNIPPDPWVVATTLKDVDEVLGNLDTLNESLGTISKKKINDLAIKTCLLSQFREMP